MKIYVADAHSLGWFIAKDKKLSQQAREILRQGEIAEVEVLIPTIVLAELHYITQQKRIETTIEKILEQVEQADGFVVIPFDFEVFQIMLKLSEAFSIHDRIIAATARHYEATILTKDQILRDSDQVETVW
ncbi:MAG: type II toxin-antitoxin system VapC family toxin [Candidatus Bipolaricaulia bacterium]